MIDKGNEPKGNEDLIEKVKRIKKIMGTADTGSSGKLQ